MPNLPLALFLAAPLLQAPDGPTPAPEPVSWETSMEAAVARAEAEGKPILVLQLFGRLDEELC